ncbi:hypothetical protein Q5425_03015 [Amycolatopsis sp. A133]|uniref:hypothetical protein n=1 Tax=Amycolatopsis sp. A133 TaxID=3064472 RepID=UPI0027F268D3|nr:hypothetical protein [Amycolatopsis sp. A133]MDQ7802686.1 hypothetical protein [Amycolatopsis sp. A133]
MVAAEKLLSGRDAAREVAVRAARLAGECETGSGPEKNLVGSVSPQGFSGLVGECQCVGVQHGGLTTWAAALMAM